MRLGTRLDPRAEERLRRGQPLSSASEDTDESEAGDSGSECATETDGDSDGDSGSECETETAGVAEEPQPSHDWRSGLCPELAAYEAFDEGYAASNTR